MENLNLLMESFNDWNNGEFYIWFKMDEKYTKIGISYFENDKSYRNFETIDAAINFLSDK